MVRRKHRSPRSLSQTDTQSSKRTNSNFHFARRRTSRIKDEIRYLQNRTHLLIPKAAVTRLVKEIIGHHFPRTQIDRIQSRALEALHTAIECYLTLMFEESYLLALHAKRVTLKPEDIRVLRRIRHIYD